MTQRDDTRHNLRLTASLHKRLKLSAVENERSMNAEINIRLDRSFASDPALLIAEVLKPVASLSEADRERVGELLIDLGSILSKTGKPKSGAKGGG